MATVSKGTRPTKVPATPRPSASAVIVNGRNEILFVQRNPEARSFGGTYVFPGGNFDPKQDESLQMTAIRETFEESGLLLASSQSSSSPNLEDSALDEARNSIHSDKMLFRDFLSQNKLKADVGSLLPFTQWITPRIVPRRFHAQFFVTFLPSAPSTGFSSGDKQQRLPTPDGGQEVISARFIHPTNLISEFHSGAIALMPPQYYIVDTLSTILKGHENTQEQRDLVATLSSGLFGSMVINPEGLPKKDDKGRTVLTYEGDETRGGKKGRLHRSLVMFGPGGVPTEIELQRNFDVFTEIEPHVFSRSQAKL
ncbi:hypothetical protein JAAARDRAFT_32120 [Jaapia argillacea MUCL 33604]|uniref:Nudix hydrolase domain-containing protein n=1 Tax=Jaapia argillacea MUCL 33604 TaxID=933084 RepID=A0A067QER9_9AGAM|nr:hypothetical protein JAAARDRAFT_32120 [Jaapia argillacea MUCL 33604]